MPRREDSERILLLPGVHDAERHRRATIGDDEHCCLCCYFPDANRCTFAAVGTCLILLFLAIAYIIIEYSPDFAPLH